MSLETPCIAVCTIDPKSRLCIGCGRTLTEIARWRSMAPSERRTIMAELPRAWRKPTCRRPRRGARPIANRIQPERR